MIQGEPRMSRAEVVVEVEWMLAGGVSPALIVQELKRSPSAIERICRVEGRKDLATRFYAEAEPIPNANKVRTARRRVARSVAA